MRTGLLRHLVLALLVLPLAVRAEGQLTSSAAAGTAFERYSFADPDAIDIETLSLLTVPFGARLELGRRVMLGVTGDWARAVLVHADGEEVDFAGLTDTEISVSVSLVPGSVALTAVALLPTGSSSMSFDEMIVAGAIAADQLPFRITNWGLGGGAGASLAFTRPIGDWAAGFSVGYVVGRTFEPLEGDAFEYRPGNQFQAAAAIDRVIGTTTKVALQLKYQHYDADQGDGRNLFQTGDRFSAVGSLDFAVGQSSAIVYAGWLNRDTAELFDPPEILPAQKMLYTGAGLRTALGSTVLQPSVDLRIVDAETQPGYTLGVGASLEAPAGRSTLIPSARFRFGNVESIDGVTSGFTGLDLGFSVRFGVGAR